MVSTWVEASAKGRLGGPVRAGMWSTVVLGTYPIEDGQEVWLELTVDDQPLGPLPAYWLENKGVNSLWHVPIPPQPVGARLRYRSVARRRSEEPAFSPHQEVVVRPNMPDRTESGDMSEMVVEGLVGNRRMSVRVDGRGSTFDVYFPTVGLHSQVRPAQGDLPHSRSHFRSIVGGLALGRRVDWFNERLSWESSQSYLGVTNLLQTALRWRRGPVRVLATDFVATGPNLPRTADGTESAGQYLKRFRITNDGAEPRRAQFGIYVQAEVNGGLGEPGLSWHEGDLILLAANRGHGHTNKKLARDATVEFALALDRRGEVHCEPTGPNEAMMFRWIDLPAGGTVTVDLLVSGAFTNYRGDVKTFEHWIAPALSWFRAADLDSIEQEAASYWDAFVEPLPSLDFPKAIYAVALRRSALAAALHADSHHGSIASGYDRGLHAYCWPRDALSAGGALDRAGHSEIGRGILRWLNHYRQKGGAYRYWFQKYTIDGVPEWETPSVDQAALIPWAMERHFRRTGDLALVEENWASVEQAAAVCGGASGHPGLQYLAPLALVSSAGLWDNRYGAFTYSNACVVAGLRAACRLARLVDRTEEVDRWQALADRIWELGILGEAKPEDPGPGLFDPEHGRFLDARRLSTIRGLWSDDPKFLMDRSAAFDISLLALSVPFGLLPASDPRMVQTARAIQRANRLNNDAHALICWKAEPSHPEAELVPSESLQQDVSSLASLWMARYLLQLGRETGDGSHWTQALALLDEILSRLGPLGLVLGGRSSSPGVGPAPHPEPVVSALHAMLIETLLDLAGLDYDASKRLLLLEPILPKEWPKIGLTQPFLCGEVQYELLRSGGGSDHWLSVTARLDVPVTLQVALTCPTIESLGEWRSNPEAPPPKFDRLTRRLDWIVDLPVGESRFDWRWG